MTSEVKNIKHEICSRAEIPNCALFNENTQVMIRCPQNPEFSFFRE